MGKKRVKRRQQHGSAWHWKQTDCWYYTEPGTRKRVPLFDEKGERVRGKENKEAARMALARAKLADELQPTQRRDEGDWSVARVCDVYLGNLKSTASSSWARQVQGWLEDLCRYCGALEVGEFKRRHLRNWLARHSNWSDNTKRNVIGSVKAAFNFCVRDGDIDVNPVAGYEKPTQVPRVTSFTPEEEKALYEATDESFGLFIRACILTGAITFYFGRTCRKWVSPFT